MQKVFASWSGGKDCCLALNRALAEGLDVRYLANTVTADGQRSCSHGMAAAVIRTQAQALGIPIVQQPTTGDNYRDEFVKMLQAFKGEGIREGSSGISISIRTASGLKGYARKRVWRPTCRYGGKTSIN